MKSESRVKAPVLSPREFSITLKKEKKRKNMGLERLHAGVQNEYDWLSVTIKKIRGVLNLIHSYFFFCLWGPCASSSFTYTITTRYIDAYK